MTPTLETDRLWLYPLELSDADQIQVLFPQWEIVARALALSAGWRAHLYPRYGSASYRAR